MDRRIIYSRIDGGLNIVIPCRGTDEVHLSDDDIFQRAFDKLPNDAINPQTLTKTDILPDRTFRNAWEHGGDKIVVNMEKAKVIHLEKIRTVRDAKLKELDVQAVIAMGKGDTTTLAEIEAQKEVLRNLPQTIDLTKAATPEELKAIWPEELV